MSTTWLNFSPWSCFERSVTCPSTGCFAPVLCTRDILVNVWLLVHGETPVACWKDQVFGDRLDVRAFDRDFMYALSDAHWRLRDNVAGRT